MKQRECEERTGEGWVRIIPPGHTVPIMLTVYAHAQGERLVWYMVITENGEVVYPAHRLLSTTQNHARLEAFYVALVQYTQDFENSVTLSLNVAALEGWVAVDEAT